ncbi:MAG TPA: DUF2752 domain-containing protein [Fuerstia sp.]|nr:DUF2752 domain-containing protein [Fuerstiella sp.]
MTSLTENERPPRGIRILMGLFAASMIAVFAVACWLQPDPRGFGTHLQLGLPPCQFKELTGMHCPHCGMTTSFSHVVRGNFSAAWSANPCGVLLAFVCGLCIPWAAAVSSTGRWILTRQPFHWFVFGAIGYVCFAFSIWILRSFIL